jgi:hypothetical protein
LSSAIPGTAAIPERCGQINNLLQRAERHEHPSDWFFQ